MPLHGKRTVIIGGSSGIGLATARAILAEGASVVIASRSESKLQRAKAGLQGPVQTSVLDAVRERDVQQFFEALGPFDHLVTTASGFAAGPFKEFDTAAARLFFEGKFWGQYYAAKYAATHIREGGSITFFAGIASRKAFPALAVVAAVDGAIESLAKTLAVELAPIRVNVVSPGVVETPIFEYMAEATRRQFFESFASRLPVNRIGQPEDVAATVLYLMQNPYATGTVIDVDGGYMVL